MVDNENVICAPQDFNIKIVKWRVREGFPVRKSQVILIYEIYDDKIDKEIKRLKSNKVGVVKKRLHDDGGFVEKGQPLLELCECNHTTVIKDMCADCGVDLKQNENGFSEASVPMIHSIPDLKVTQKLAQQLGQADTERLLEDHKLVLLVDLDQTLIHTTNDNVPHNIKGIYHFQLYGANSPWYHTRLRPRTKEFLENLAPYFELHICTFGARNYAHMIAQLLDPDGKYFSHRILSRDECFNVTYKTDNLKALFPCGDSMVCIIDDREDVWNMASNLIQVKPYHFFQHTGDINAPPGLSKHELDGKGVDFKDLKISPKITVPNDNGKCLTKSDDKNKINEIIVKQENENADIESESVDTNVKSKNDDFNDVESKEKEDKVQIEHESIESDEDIKKKLKSDNESKENGNEAQNISENENSTLEKQIQNKTKDDKVEIDNDELKKTVKSNSTNLTKTTQETSSDSITQLKDQEFIEIEDPDDYLLYLETILLSIHRKFYEIYDEEKIIPDLKILVPQLRSKVLQNLNLVFSGLVPNQMKLEHSRAYLIAKSLGAEVTQYLNDKTTHLVAVTVGTFKYNAARKRKDIFIVTPDWLWCCAERWERVDEKLFPLDPHKPSKMRQPPPHCHSPEHVVNYNEISLTGQSSSSSSLKNKSSAVDTPKFIDTINPLLSFSNADLAEMNQEFDLFFESDSSSSEDEHMNIEVPPINKALLKRKREENDEDHQRKFFIQSDETIAKTSLITEKPEDSDDADDENDDDKEDESLDKKKDDSSSDETINEKFRRGEKLPSDVEIGSDESQNSDNPGDDEDDGKWNMMGAALEREFLGLEK